MRATNQPKPNCSNAFLPQGLGDKCPYFIDPANNDLTGRVIETTEVKELIVQLHNEVGWGWN